MKSIVSALVLTLCSSLSLSVSAKDTVKIAYIGPLTGGVSANGIGGRNSADLAVRLKNRPDLVIVTHWRIGILDGLFHRRRRLSKINGK